MATGIIIHHNGVYNFISTETDSPCFVSGLTRAQLEKVVKEEDGRQGLDALSQRLDRAHRKGTSSGLESSLVGHVDTYNRVHHHDFTLEQFIAKFLTLDPAIQEANTKNAEAGLDQAYTLVRLAQHQLPDDVFKKQAAALYSFLHSRFNPQ
jgi:hypothetical protein